MCSFGFLEELWGVMSFGKKTAKAPRKNWKNSMSLKRKGEKCKGKIILLIPSQSLPLFEYIRHQV